MMKKYVIISLSVTFLIVLSFVVKSIASNYKSVPLVVELYEKEDFGGRKIVIAFDTPDLEEYCFNDKANSMKVFRGPSYTGGAKVKVYSGKDYKGGYMEFTADEEVKNLENDKGFGNTVSSVKFPY